MNATLRSVLWVGASSVVAALGFVVLGLLVGGGTVYVATRESPPDDGAAALPSKPAITLSPGEVARADDALAAKMAERLVVRWESRGFGLSKVDQGCTAGHEEEIDRAVRNLDDLLNTTVRDLRANVPGMATTMLSVRAHVTGQADGYSPVREDSDTCERLRADVANFPSEEPRGVRWKVDPLPRGDNCNDAFALRRAGVCAGELARKFELLQFEVERGSFGMEILLHAHVNRERGAPYRGADVEIISEIVVPGRFKQRAREQIAATGGTLLDS